jgi:hypothetical protein
MLLWRVETAGHHTSLQDPLAGLWSLVSLVEL